MTPLQLLHAAQAKRTEYEEALRSWPNKQAVAHRVEAFFATTLLELESAWRRHPYDAEAMLNEISRINRIIDSHKE